MICLSKRMICFENMVQLWFKHHYLTQEIEHVEDSDINGGFWTQIQELQE